MRTLSHAKGDPQLLPCSATLCRNGTTAWQPMSPGSTAPAAAKTRHQGVARAARRRHPLMAAQAIAGSRSSSSSGGASSGAMRLQEWLEGEGGMGTGFLVEVGETSQGHPCLVARRAVKPGEVLLQVPENAWVTPTSTVLASTLGPAVSGLEPWVQLVLWMVWAEALRGEEEEDGALHPYCSSLPPRCSTLSPLFWTEEEAALLEGSQCLDLVTSYREFLEAKLEELEEGLFRSNRSLFPSEVFTPEAFLRAFGCLRARAHPPLDQGEGIALVPMADLVQHSGASSSSWEVREDRGLFGAASSGDRKVSLTADRPYVPGEPIEMNFLLGREDVAAAGGLESQLAVDYGALDPAASGFSLPLAIPADDPFFQDKVDVAELSGLGESATWVLRSADAPPDELLAYLRLIHCGGEDAFHLEAMFRDAAWSHFLGPISPENERAVCETVVQGCRAALERYPSTVEEDLRLLLLLLRLLGMP